MSFLVLAVSLTHLHNIAHYTLTGYPDIYLMKLVNTHVMNVKGIGNILENFMMYNSRMDAIPYG